MLAGGIPGLTGGHCLNQLLADESFSQVIALARQPLGRVHPKSRVQIVDFDHLRDQVKAIAIDAVLCSSGLLTDRRIAGSLCQGGSYFDVA